MARDTTREPTTLQPSPGLGGNRAVAMAATLLPASLLAKPERDQTWGEVSVR